MAKRVVGKQGIEKTLPDLAALLEKRNEQDQKKAEAAMEEAPMAVESAPIANIVDTVMESAGREERESGEQRA